MLLREGAAALQAAGIGPSHAEAEWLLSRLLGVRPLELYLLEQALPAQIVDTFQLQVAARAAGWPLQYLIGEAAFYGRIFEVGPGVFIPRPETETVVEAALAALRGQPGRGAWPVGAPNRACRVLEVGVGSGCIAVTVACELPACLVVGVEVSWVALQAARRNTRRHRVDDRVALVQGSWLDALRGMWDAVISNPPYVPTDQVERLPLDVRQEPAASLDGGPAGRQALRHLLAAAPRVLRSGGILAMECGEEQVGWLLDEAQRGPFAESRPLQDVAEHPRGVLLTRA